LCNYDKLFVILENCSKTGKIFANYEGIGIILIIRTEKWTKYLTLKMLKNVIMISHIGRYGYKTLIK